MDEQEQQAPAEENALVVEEPATEPEPDPGPSEEVWDPEKALAKIRKSNAENQKLRERAKAAEAAIAAGEGGEKTQRLHSLLLAAEENNDTLKAEADTRLSEIESRMTEAEQRAAQAERRYVAAKYGLPDALAERLRGGTVDEMVEDAQALLEAVRAPARTPGVDFTSAPNQSALSDEDIDGFVIGAM